MRGRIRDLFGETFETVVAPGNGVVRTLSPKRVVYLGSIVYRGWLDDATSEVRACRGDKRSGLPSTGDPRRSVFWMIGLRLVGVGGTGPRTSTIVPVLPVSTLAQTEHLPCWYAVV